MSYNLIKDRLDLSDWLIHFTRDFQGRSAKDNLISIIKMGRLVPSWAERNGAKTIYGIYPAVCFSEQPLWAFAEYARNRRNKVSEYGVLVHKCDAFAMGALPVIYGINGLYELQSEDAGYDPQYRKINHETICEEEQYRVVRFNPNRDRHPADWTHEREWRWSSKQDISGIGGFHLGGRTADFSDRGMSEGRAHIFVPTEWDVELFQNEISSMSFNESNFPPDDFWQAHVKNSIKIIPLDRVNYESENGKYLAKAENFILN